MAYYALPIAQEHQKFLKFFGSVKCINLRAILRAQSFHKIIKTTICNSKKPGHLFFGYIDDTYLQGETANDCSKTIDATVAVFKKVGFIKNPDKSVSFRK